MSRLFSDIDDVKPDINSESVKLFFEERAKKVLTGEVSYKQGVIYQDKSKDLAETRDKLEKELLLPKLNLSLNDNFLDIGCGTGRWAELVIDKVGYYHGTDLIESLVQIAKTNNKQSNASFQCVPCTELSLDKIDADQPFNKIIMFGVLVYLNDSEIELALNSVVEMADNECVFLLREPIGIDQRLTIREHFSEDMEQFYNAIYRTEDEIKDFCNKYLIPYGFKLVETDDVFKQVEYNNRVETKQKYFLFKR